jgi:hypothetical protein
MRLEHALVLNRYFHGWFDARDLTELKQPLNVQEGRAADGQSLRGYHNLLVPLLSSSRIESGWTASSSWQQIWSR